MNVNLSCACRNLCMHVLIYFVHDFIYIVHVLIYFVHVYLYCVCLIVDFILYGSLYIVLECVLVF